MITDRVPNPDLAKARKLLDAVHTESTADWAVRRNEMNVRLALAYVEVARVQAQLNLIAAAPDQVIRLREGM